MANLCDYTIRAKGSMENLHKLEEWLGADYDYNAEDKIFCYKEEIIDDAGTKEKVPLPHHIGFRSVYDSCLEASYYKTVYGEDIVGLDSCCAWSVCSCMMETYSKKYKKLYPYHLSLPEACKLLHVEAEVYSYESGCEFSEHYLIDTKGNVIIDECVDVEEFSPESSVEEFLDRAEYLTAKDPELREKYPNTIDLEKVFDNGNFDYLYYSERRHDFVNDIYEEWDWEF